MNSKSPIVAPPPTRRRRRGERGQVMIVFVLLITVLVGFAGLALDASLAQMDHRQMQAAADAAALAASYEVYASATSTTVTAVATGVATDNGCFAAQGCSVTITYYSSVNTSIACCTSVDHITVVITGAHANSFIQVLGGGPQTTVTVAAVAKVKDTATGGTSVTCGLCVLNPGAVANAITNTGAAASGITVTTGNFLVKGAISFSGDTGTIEAKTGSTVGTTAASNTTTGWTSSPAITVSCCSGAVADPFASLTAINTGTLTSRGATYTPPTGSNILLPGLYGQVTINNNNTTLIFAPGNYAFTGGITITAGVTGTVLQGSGVTFFFTCGTFATPSACSNAAGAALTLNAPVSMNLMAPTTGTYANVLIDAVGNTSAFALGANITSARNTGALYIPRAALSWTTLNTNTRLGGPIIVGTLNVGGGTLVTGMGGAGCTNAICSGYLAG